MGNKIDNSLTFGNVPDDFLCPCDGCPLWNSCPVEDDDEDCMECQYSEAKYERELEEGDRKFDERRDREL